MSYNSKIKKYESLCSAFTLNEYPNFWRNNSGVYSLKDLSSKYVDLQEKTKQSLTVVDEVSELTLDRALEGLTEIYDIINYTASLTDADFIHERNNIIVRFDIGLSKYNSVWPDFLSRINTKEINKIKESTDIKRYTKEIEYLKKQIEYHNAKAQNDSTSIGTLRDELLAKVAEFENRYKDVATKIETDSIKFTFGEEAEKNNLFSKLWLAPVCLFLLSLISLIYFFWSNICLSHLCVLENGIVNYSQLKGLGVEYTQSLFIYDNIRVLLFKAFCLSLNIYLLTFCLRQYSIQRHNYTINKHKANSLQAAIYLLEKISSDTPQSKQEVIKHAVEAIFSHQKTGYNSKDKEADLNLITTLLKNIKT